MEDKLKTELKNMTNGKKYVTSLLKNYRENDKINNLTILYLLSFHPTKNIDIKNIDYLIIKNRKPYNRLALHYKYKNDDKIDDISYILCIKNLFGKYNNNKSKLEDIISSFRHECHHGSKKRYFINNITFSKDMHIGTCSNCKIETSDITTDHYKIPFKKILDDFCNETKINLKQVKIFENKKCELLLKDRKLAENWLNFHDKLAQYRLLCKSCNSRFGSYNYV